MPYIKQLDRIAFKPYLDYLLLVLTREGFKPGWINYMITSIIIYWWKSSPQTYETINAIVGCLDCAKLEFYRRIAVPYEEGKIKENGDVYTP